LGTEVRPEDVLAYLAAVTAHPAYTRTFRVELETPGVRIPITADPALWAEAIEVGRKVVWAQTFGRSFADGEEMPAGKIAYPKGDSRRVLCRVPVQRLPAGYVYDDEAHEIEVGGGRFGPVSRAVADYEVGGKNVLKSWVGYRAKEPAGKRTSPLDNITPTSWEHGWTQDLNEVLTVLGRLVELEPEQNDLLGRILDGPVLTIDDLTSAGVAWPQSDKDRKPRYSGGGLF
jgi:hypothetical protein